MSINQKTGLLKMDMNCNFNVCVCSVWSATEYGV